MGHPRSSGLIWSGLGLMIALALHAVAGWGAATGFAQGTTNTSITESSTTSTSFESPPACSVVGASRQVETVTLQVTVGPGCIGIGNRDVVNPAPDCGGLPPANPDPSRGTPFLVTFGNSNVNANTHTETIQCVAAVPALPWPALLGLGGALSGLGWLGLKRRRRGTNGAKGLQPLRGDEDDRRGQR